MRYKQKIITIYNYRVKNFLYNATNTKIKRCHLLKNNQTKRCFRFSIKVSIIKLNTYLQSSNKVRDI